MAYFFFQNYKINKILFCCVYVLSKYSKVQQNKLLSVQVKILISFSDKIVNIIFSIAYQG